MVKKIAIVCGPRPSYGYCPVPPATNSAPERNIYRLAEFDYGNELELHVVSACNDSQLEQFQQINFIGHYHWVQFPDYASKINLVLGSDNRWISAAYNRLLHVPDLLTWNYLFRACGLINQISPDLILINSLPQYINYIKKRFPDIKLGLFVRGEMGRSRKYLPLLNLIITNSNGISEYVYNLLNGTPVPISRISNTLENSFCSTPKIYSESKRVLYTGRIDPVKGVLELILAFELVQKKFPDAQLTIVGGNFGKKSLTLYEQRLIDETSARHLNIEFVGQVPNSRLPDYYQRADLAVFPSIWLESFGMVALEAMRCGLPVVASRRPGFEELIIEGETGIIINDPTNINSIAEAIVQLLANPERLMQMGEKGYLRSMEYSPEISAKKFVSAIKALFV